jgi:hypothetical protein
MAVPLVRNSDKFFDGADRGATASLPPTQSARTRERAEPLGLGRYTVNISRLSIMQRCPYLPHDDREVGV